MKPIGAHYFPAAASDPHAPYSTGHGTRWARMTADCTSSRAVQNHHRQEDTLSGAQRQRCAQLRQAASTLQPQRLAVHVGQQGWHRARGEAHIHQGQMAEEVVHGRTRQEVAEEEGGEDRLPGGPIREAQQEEALLCAVVALKQETPGRLGRTTHTGRCTPYKQRKTQTMGVGRGNGWQHTHA